MAHVRGFLLLLFYAVTNSKRGYWYSVSLQYFSRSEERGLPNNIDGEIIDHIDR